MALVAVAAVVIGAWYRAAGPRGLASGVGLWTVAIVVKVPVALTLISPLVALSREKLPYGWAVTFGGLAAGLWSAACEMGTTWLAVRCWPSLAQDRRTAVAVGLGAGALEALLLGASAALAAVAALSNLPGTEPVRSTIEETTAVPLFWLVGPLERIQAIVCHVATRTLVLFGVVHDRPRSVWLGFALFAALDSLAAAAKIAGATTGSTIWFVEASFVPITVLSAIALAKHQWTRVAPATQQR